MVSSHITSDAEQPIILNRMGCDASAHRHSQNADDTAPLAVEVPPASPANNCATSTQSLNNSRCFTKITAVAMIAAYIVSSASAFTQPQNRMRATPVSRPALLSSDRTKNALPSFLSRTQSFLSAGKSSSDSGKADQEEWRAVFLALNLYKAAFGDLKVPTKFVVPSAAPWPGM